MIDGCICGKELRIFVKPNAKKTEILEIDKKDKSVKIAIKEPAENNKANLAVVKFFSKKLRKEVKIKRGLNSKEKILEIL